MVKESQNRLEHFAALKSKYQATQYQDSLPTSLLYLILRKIDLGIELLDLESNWLGQSQLEETLKVIKEEQQRKVQEFGNLEFEFSKLKSKYKATNYNDSWQSSHLYFILLKLESGNLLTDSEVKWLRANGLYETNKIAQEVKLFSQLKSKYKATQYQDSYPDSPLYQILKKLDLTERLSNSEYNWLLNKELFEITEIFKQQESVKETHFYQLRDKYQANQYSNLSFSTPLYRILQNIDANKNLSESEINWLEQQRLSETISIAEELKKTRKFAALKAKYKVTDYEDSSPKSHLYKVLKRLDLSNQLGEQDINFLNKRKLTKIIEIANEKYTNTLKFNIESGQTINESETHWLQKNGREDIIFLAQQKHFVALKSKYDVLDYQDKSHTSLLYAILQKLELEERLEATDVAWLQETKYQETNLFSGKIRIAYHTIEANFYEQEFQRTDNKWNLANASSHWRKADEPQQALQLTNNLEFDKIKENKLKSALLTSRGGAFRDIEKLDKAENCARQAIEYQPKSHHPYTLMGAICFERHQYSDGEYWFQEAIKRGANPRDMDSEIKRVVKNIKDENKRREVIEYLLKKDAQRYSWAKFYLKKSQNNR
jgi:hypothetical protein